MIGGKIELNEINQSIDKIRLEIKALRNLVDQFNKEQAEEAVKQTSFSFYDSVKNENIKLGSSPPFEISIENAVKQLIKKRDQLMRNDDTKYRENINKLNNTIKQIYNAKSKQDIINLLKRASSGTWKNNGFNGGMKTKRKRKAKKYSHKK